MKFLQRVLCGVLFISEILTLHAGQLPVSSTVREFFVRSDEELIRNYTPPAELSALLDEHADFLVHRSDECSLPRAKKKFRTMAWRFPWLPHYYLKGRISRIKGREKVVQCIDAYNLDRLTVPEKYLYHLPGRGHDLTEYNYFVIAQRIYSESKHVILDVQEMRQITMLIKKTGLIDLFTTNNILRDKSGKLVLVDTEDKKGSICYGIHKLITKGKWNINTSFTPDALKCLLHESMECAANSKELYRIVYHKILKKLLRSKRADSWDYVTYFTTTFPEPT